MVEVFPILFRPHGCGKERTIFASADLLANHAHRRAVALLRIDGPENLENILEGATPRDESPQILKLERALGPALDDGHLLLVAHAEPDHMMPVAHIDEKVVVLLDLVGAEPVVAQKACDSAGKCGGRHLFNRNEDRVQGISPFCCWTKIGLFPLSTVRQAPREIVQAVACLGYKPDFSDL